jgi:transcriptional regulator with XRE-family HTH domain
MSFGEKLQALRRENGLTQEDFAAQMKVSRQAVSKWESSRGYPEIEKIIYICNRYGVTMDELFAEEVPVVQEE